MKYEALFEDEDNIFGGSPRSKFHDIVYNANRDIVEMELERLIERQAVLENMLGEEHGDDFDEKIKRYHSSNRAEVESKAKSLFIESVGNILSQNE